MFAWAKDAPIRTAAVNDFILKNTNVKNGLLNKSEFRTGVLLGFWDRQTDFWEIFEEDERTMKNLRWKDNHMVDIKAQEYIRELKRREAIKSAKFRNAVNKPSNTASTKTASNPTGK
jgi:hypothetical protein